MWRFLVLNKWFYNPCDDFNGRVGKDLAIDADNESDIKNSAI